MVGAGGRGDGQTDLGDVRIEQRVAGRKHGLARHTGRPQAGDPVVAGMLGEEAPPAHGPLVQRTGDLVAVVPVLARFVPQHLDERGVHALAPEPDLEQLAVGAGVQEVRERRTLLPIPLDLGGGALGATDHGAERGEEPVVQRRVAPAALPRLLAAAQQREHTRSEHKRRAGACGPRVDEYGSGPMACELGAEPGARLDQQGIVVDRALAGTAGPAPGVDEVWVQHADVVESESLTFDDRLGPIGDGHVGRPQQIPDLSGVVGRDDLLVAMPHAAPRDMVVDRSWSIIDDPDDRRTELGEHHARYAAGQPEPEGAGPASELDHGQPLAGREARVSTHSIDYSCGSHTEVTVRQ